MNGSQDSRFHKDKRAQCHQASDSFLSGCGGSCLHALKLCIHSRLYLRPENKLMLVFYLKVMQHLILSSGQNYDRGI